jgi:oligopeptide/dipeptide ABC transporter ATP-binding protein
VTDQIHALDDRGQEISAGRPAAPLLRVENLDVRFEGRRRLFRGQPAPIRAVNGVSFQIPAGTTFGLVGESGSGKSTVARAILNLLRPDRGRIELDGRDVTDLSGRELLRFRKRVQAVLQDPFSSLNQIHDVSVIVGDPITRHRFVPRGRERDELVVELLELVGLSADVLRRHPYEMSGGQRQRVSIARALAVQPDLVIADEPTSALDVSIQSQVINLLGRIQRHEGLAYLAIAHDLEIVKHMSHDVGVLYLGYLVEIGPVDGVYDQPAHPYTEMLIASIPVPDPAAQAERRRIRRSLTVDAEPPSPADVGRGCPFASRCPAVFEPCPEVMPEPVPAHHGGATRCHLHTEGPVLGGRSVVPYLRSVAGERRSSATAGEVEP